MDVALLQESQSIARSIRMRVIEMSHRAKTPHLGSSLSCVDILVATYRHVLKIDPQAPDDPIRDRFILSKGHAAPTLYAMLAHQGFFNEKLLDTFATHGSPLAEQPAPRCAPGVEWATGSLGHGLGAGLGMALAARIQGREYSVYALLSDGECNEGTVWEAALFAPRHNLSNVAVIVDYNKWQATGRSNEIMAMEPLVEKWRAFGWQAYEADGHDIEALVSLLQTMPQNNKPLAIIAHTIKGKGVSFMQDDNNWHYRIPNAEEVERARMELKP